MNGSDKPREGLQLSTELLNAFVDDQLDSEEKSRIFVEVNNDEKLSREVCELRKVRDLVQLAYRDIPGAPKPRTAPSRRVPLGVAAGLALAMGATLGWFLHHTTPANTPAAGATVATTSEPLKVLMHVADDNTIHLAQALDDIEASLEHFHRTGTNARLEVIINGNGLVLVREDATVFADRIEKLQKKYDNLAFMACQNTIDRLKRDTGITAKLLPGVVVIDSGVAQLMRRQNQGWAYIQA